MYVHHTASSNKYTEAQAFQQIRGIYDYHTKVLKWDDIGYQFLVDRFGNIYEGRRGSMNDLIVGAQAGGYNANTIGVSAMGNFDDEDDPKAKPPKALVEALTRLLAWKGYQYNLDVKGTTTLTTTTAGPSTARYKNGVKVTVPVIVGHRNTNLTACPGQYLYSKLGSIRTEVSRRIAKTTETYGKARAVLKAPVASGNYSGDSPVSRDVGAADMGDRFADHVIGRGVCLCRRLPVGEAVVALLIQNEHGGGLAVRDEAQQLALVINLIRQPLQSPRRLPRLTQIEMPPAGDEQRRQEADGEQDGCHEPPKPDFRIRQRFVPFYRVHQRPGHGVEPPAGDENGIAAMVAPLPETAGRFRGENRIQLRRIGRHPQGERRRAVAQRRQILDDIAVAAHQRRRGSFADFARLPQQGEQLGRHFLHADDRADLRIRAEGALHREDGNGEGDARLSRRILVEIADLHLARLQRGDEIPQGTGQGWQAGAADDHLAAGIQQGEAGRAR